VSVIPRRVAGAAVLLLFSLTSNVAAEDAGVDWRPSVRWAARYAEGRQGEVRFAVIDQRGRFYGHDSASAVPAASVFKVMLMVAYLRLPSVRGRELREADRDLLAPMIRWSDNAAATRVRDVVGGDRIYGLASRARMRDFELHSTWGLSLTSARDQVRFMYRLERHIPDRHQSYARRLLSTIVRSQRWGVPKVAPTGWKLFFKGGWGSGTGRVAHQVAFLESGEQRVALAILTSSSPSHEYAITTVREVARRILKGLRRA